MSDSPRPDGGPSADVSCRVAWADDAPAIGAVQSRAWRQGYAEVLPPEMLAAFEPEAMAQAWAESLARPGDARNRVLVALERNRVVGFAVTGPASDPDCDPVADGEVVELVVDPTERGRGHGSRLMQACVDTLLGDRFTRAVTWLPVADDAARAFWTAAGWQPDGAHRELAVDDATGGGVRQVRLHTRIAG